MTKIHPSDPNSSFFYPVNKRVSGLNTLCTSHYTAWNFFFLNLFEQLHRLANLFFIFCAIIQAIPYISSLDPVMGFLGLAFMLGISMLKAGYEDYRRHKADDEVNNKVVTLWRPSGINEKIKWMNVQPGDILIIENNSEFPADCVILESSSLDKRSRIQTAALDGETDLKYKRNVVDDADLKNTYFHCEMTSPTPKLTSFKGSIVLGNATKYQMNISNFVPRGCVLKQTQFVLALVVYTGENTKIIMNSAKPRYKYTEIDRFLSYFVIFSIAFLVGLSILFTVLSYFYNRRNGSQGYLQLDQESKKFVYYFCQVLSWVLVINYFIPLSLYSSLDIVRFFLSLMISFDPQLTDKNGRKCSCRNSDLVYTIGRITHVFSDKTGTLTKNLMTFKIVGFSDIALGLKNGEDEDEYVSNMYSDEYSLENTIKRTKNIDTERLFNFSDDDFQYIKDNINVNKDILFFIYTIIFCHNAMTSVNPQYYDISEIQRLFPDYNYTFDLPPPKVVAKFPYIITYLTGSPDELCLLHIARECGYILYDVDRTTVKVIINGEVVNFDRPVTFDYNSKRKRGSCITKINNKYYMLMKGADTIINNLCSNPQDSLFNDAQSISEIGLRTLVYAVKEINDIDPIIRRYNEIKLMNDAEEEAMEEFSNNTELGVKVIAVTGVEDELQDDVGLTLSRLRMANIKVWMLTGDKLSTALNIGKTTELISIRDKIVTLDYDDCTNNFEKLRNIKNFAKTVLCLEGSTFGALLNSEDLINEFYKYSSLCSGVIIARCEPSQKGNVVRSFKNFDKKSSVLAIGDGANDVDMIRAADVGIGVEGKEGSEAVMSSDFSIPSFHHIASLLIVHGRWCVNRVSLLIGLTLYKTAIIGILQIFYGFFNGFSATSTFDSAYLTVYNLLLTIPQLFFICVLEQNLSARYALAVPHIYQETQTTGGLSAKGLIEFYTLAILHAAMIFFYSYLESNKVILNIKGTTFDYALFTQITGWTLLFVFTFTLLTRFRTITIIHILLYVACVLIYILIELIYSYTNQMFYAVVPILFSTPRVWFTIPICVGACLIIDLVLIYFRNLFSKSLSNAVAELEYVEEKGNTYLF